MLESRNTCKRDASEAPLSSKFISLSAEAYYIYPFVWCQYNVQDLEGSNPAAKLRSNLGNT
jgi:hypothetical protein